MSAKPENEGERIKAAINEHVQLRASGAPCGGWTFVGLDKAADAIIAQRDSGEPVVGTGDTICQACSAPNSRWFAPSNLWNLVVGGPGATDDPGGVLCIPCFIRRAENAGVQTAAWFVGTEEPIPRAPAEAQARVEALEAALKPFVDLWSQVGEDDRVRRAWLVTVRVTSDAIRKARALLSGSTPKLARVEIDDAMVERAARSAALIAERKAMQGVRAAMVFASNADYRRALEARVEGSWRDHVETVRPLLTAALSTAPAKDGEG